MEYQRHSDKLKGKFVIAPVAGGYYSKSRMKCIEAITHNGSDVDAFLIDGLHNGPEAEFLPFNELNQVAKFIVQNLHSEKLCSIQGCWDPITILKLVQLGIDLFDTSYCRILTERSAAMTFAIDEDEHPGSYEINLRQKLYADDFTPIMNSCDCLSCREYTKSYIHHLLTVQELLGPILIMIHNIYHYLRLFKKITKCISKDTLSLLEQKMSEQYRHFQTNVTTNHLEDEHLGFTENEILNT